MSYVAKMSSASFISILLLIVTITFCKTNEGPFRPLVDPDKCEGKTICPEVSNYPKDYIEGLLLQEDPEVYFRLLADIETKDTHDVSLKKRQIQPEVQNENKTTKLNEVCKSRHVKYSPTTGKSTNNKWYFIVNDQKNKQIIEAQICSNPSTECEIKSEGVKTECRQNFTNKEMLALDEDGKIVKKLFKIPTYCSCFYEKTLI